MLIKACRAWARSAPGDKSSAGSREVVKQKKERTKSKGDFAEDGELEIMIPALASVYTIVVLQ